MPTITRALPDAHAPHGFLVPETPPGWCLACYADGQQVLAAELDGQLCAVHQRDAAAAVPRRPPTSRPLRSLERSRSYGRRRARTRLVRGRFDVHPGWRGRVPPGRVVLVDQALARARLLELVDDELWRADRRRTWLLVCRHLADGMDWRAGLVTGVTRAQLAERAGVSPRTVSRVLAWAYLVGLLVCVETGATAEFLGTDRNRCPAYVFTQPTGLPVRPVRRPSDLHGDGLGNPPASCVGNLPLGGTRGPERTSDRRRPCGPWPGRDRARTPTERTAATTTFLEWTGLLGPVPLWRAHGLLTPWWRDDACLAGLLHAVDHHPDQPGERRGDALRSARDPLRVLGYRLAPWRGRLDELPPELQSVDPDERRARTAARTGPPPSTSTVGRPASRATIDAARQLVAARRRASGGSTGDGEPRCFRRKHSPVNRKPGVLPPEAPHDDGSSTTSGGAQT